jgi:hypothetical protein
MSCLAWSSEIITNSIFTFLGQFEYWLVLSICSCIDFFVAGVTLLISACCLLWLGSYRSFLLGRRHIWFQLFHYRKVQKVQREEPPLGDGPCCWPLHYGDEPKVLQRSVPSIDLPVLTDHASSFWFLGLWWVAWHDRVKLLPIRFLLFRAIRVLTHIEHLCLFIFFAAAVTLLISACCLLWLGSYRSFLLERRQIWFQLFHYQKVQKVWISWSQVFMWCLQWTTIRRVSLQYMKVKGKLVLSILTSSYFHFNCYSLLYHAGLLIWLEKWWCLKLHALGGHWYWWDSPLDPI